MTKGEIEVFAHVAAGLVEGEVRKAVEPLHREVRALQGEVAALTARVASLTTLGPLGSNIFHLPATQVFGNRGLVNKPSSQ